MTKTESLLSRKHSVSAPYKLIWILQFCYRKRKFFFPSVWAELMEKFPQTLFQIENIWWRELSLGIPFWYTNDEHRPTEKMVRNNVVLWGCWATYTHIYFGWIFPAQELRWFQMNSSLYYDRRCVHYLLTITGTGKRVKGLTLSLSSSSEEKKRNMKQHMQQPKFTWDHIGRQKPFSK